MKQDRLLLWAEGKKVTKDYGEYGIECAKCEERFLKMEPVSIRFFEAYGYVCSDCFSNALPCKNCERLSLVWRSSLCRECYMSEAPRNWYEIVYGNEDGDFGYLGEQKELVELDLPDEEI